MVNSSKLAARSARNLCSLLLIFAMAGIASGENTKPAIRPQNLQTIPRQLSIGLQWDPVPGAWGYEVQRAKTTNGPFEMLQKYFPPLTIHNDFVGDGTSHFLYRVRCTYTNEEGLAAFSDWSKPVEGHSEALNPDELLTEVQQASFNYFYLYAHPTSGLARSSMKRGPDQCAIGATGMGLFNLAVGIERGFITRHEGAEQVLKELKFLSEKAERFHGAFPHMINGQTGKVIAFSEYDDGADIIETSFLMEGIIFAREYFSQPDPDEVEIRKLADDLWRGVEWDWFVGKAGSASTLIWHWSPHYGWKMHLPVTGFNECQIAYVLALASPTHPIEPKTYWQGWEPPNYGVSRTEFGIQLELGNRPALGPSLFMAHYSYLGLDPHQIFFRGKSYFDHFRDFCQVQVLYAESKSNTFKGYGPLWGITASAGPDGYRAFAPGSRDSGTLAPTAALSSIPYLPKESLACLLEMYEKHGSALWGPFGFYDAFNFSRDWVAKNYLCIDVGPIAPMIENYRSGLCWNTFMKAKEIQPVIKVINNGDTSHLAHEDH